MKKISAASDLSDEVVAAAIVRRLEAIDQLSDGAKLGENISNKHKTQLSWAQLECKWATACLTSRRRSPNEAKRVITIGQSVQLSCAARGIASKTPYAGNVAVDFAESLWIMLRKFTKQVAKIVFAVVVAIGTAVAQSIHEVLLNLVSTCQQHPLVCTPLATAALVFGYLYWNMILWAIGLIFSAFVVFLLLALVVYMVSRTPIKKQGEMVHQTVLNELEPAKLRHAHATWRYCIRQVHQSSCVRLGSTELESPNRGCSWMHRSAAIQLGITEHAPMGEIDINGKQVPLHWVTCSFNTVHPRKSHKEITILCAILDDHCALLPEELFICHSDMLTLIADGHKLLV